MPSAAPRVPPLMRAGMWAAALMGSLLWIGVLGAATGCGRFGINGEQVTGGEFLTTFGVSWAILGSLLLGAAYGIWTERSWSRHVVIAFWCYQLLVMEVLVTGRGHLGATISVLPFLGGSVLYFYAAEEVVAYFRVLKEREKREAEWKRPADRGRRGC